MRNPLNPRKSMPKSVLPLLASRLRRRTGWKRMPDEVKESRWHRFMQRQQVISAKRLKAKVGTRQQVIIDQVGHARAPAKWEPVRRQEHAQNQYLAKGRSKGDAPEIDGAVYIASRRPLRVGEIAMVKIERADDYDLHGMAVGF